MDERDDLDAMHTRSRPIDQDISTGLERDASCVAAGHSGAAVWHLGDERRRASYLITKKKRRA